LDDLIKNIGDNIVAKLEQIEEGSEFALLLNSSEREIREEGILLQQEIKGIKALLKAL
jgi:hypothetical protein